MDILIKNMEMPKSCNGCKLATHYFTNTHKVRCFINAEMREAEDIESRPSWCPLVALPEHGDLIDADVLDEKIKKLWFVPKQTKTEYMVAVEKTIANAPVIVEATE